MDLALKAAVVPLLRESGFTGLYPYLRRANTTHVELLTFQFDVSGGGFVIEMSRCSIGGITTKEGRHISASEVKPWDLDPYDRLQIKPREGSGTDSWFRYESGEYGRVASDALAELRLRQIVASSR
jgi:Domain of unknown function (DUF4304)